MKYMGSKRVMLEDELGEILATESESAKRFVDLFCGSGVVSWFAATTLSMPVFACDLQKFATTLAGAVIKRTAAVTIDTVEREWIAQAIDGRRSLSGWEDALGLDDPDLTTESIYRRAQRMCAGEDDTRVIWSRYGGHYFSPKQALSLDAMLHRLPKEREMGELCLAATIMAASRCAAAPGHTAQPFKATSSAGKYLRSAWSRDPICYARQALSKLCELYAHSRGSTRVIDANVIADSLKADDLVFVDPPYSSVQYSRFYHVLETIARGTCGAVQGVGRYPPQEERPKSLYSWRRTSGQALGDLLDKLAKIGCVVVLTFPAGECSNGLSGTGIQHAARRSFRVSRKSIASQFSTLGGNSVNRNSRKSARELILVLRNK